MWGLKPFGLYREVNIARYWDLYNHEWVDSWIHTWCCRCGIPFRERGKRCEA